jgi:hypothetical protein
LAGAMMTLRLNRLTPYSTVQRLRVTGTVKHRDRYR